MPDAADAQMPDAPPDAQASATSASLEPRQVLPGDLLAPVAAFDRVVLGPGVVREESRLLASQSGILRWEAADCRLWVECEKKRYVAPSFTKSKIVAGTVLRFAAVDNGDCTENAKCVCA